ncbi:hypothetical protein H072_685 [Dactylellina haptotyla CBS 200.50]|uniref:Diaminopimelate epimerase-like protein n=1 Tax=Dactylellina haptotyla (strain CBS 200.50) TaxID=1284197 RepID=S8AR83_DACHA|nr:hypothetical protein H072_685 [Dactylellina haptotyla CBS 200.50]
MPRLTYVTLDVFTTTPMVAGNPLAIVTIPADVTLTKTQEHQIAREFGYSETVFIYPLATPQDDLLSATVLKSKPDLTRISIWTVLQELPFAGHPTVGTGWYLSSTGEERYTGEFKLLIPAGVLQISKPAGSSSGGRVTVDTPHKITLWERRIPTKRIGEIIGLPYTYFENDEGKIFATREVVRDGVPVISIVDGVSYGLAEFASVTVLGALNVGRKGVTLDMAADVGGTVPPGGRPFIGCYCYTVLGDRVMGGKGKVEVRTRMFFDGDQEDPATGSAACALASYLAIVRGGVETGVDEWEFEVTQGVEMGRKSDIGVRIELEKAVEGQARTVKKVFLDGDAVKVMEGVLTV